ncbi:Sperm flagellar protein 2 [Collichthys lucidus]|uniref:Sperm flagellar protein 2 n=1 Tax=Collichthys lucidus TaxID=240159 RepID=A0A4U5UT53_COLLU|nr:Sperm flagellar protein 2 [Collichthys lucidus]
MTDILRKWLNEELRLSKAVEPQTIAQDFSSGYLIGEVLHKYELQNDFSLFLKKDTSIAKVNNFSRLEPTLRLLGIPFNINTAQELMQEKPGVATSLLYQLYVSLEKMRKAKISRTMMEVMQPAAIAALHIKEREIYCHVVKRDSELKLQKISQQYEVQSQSLNDRSVMIHPIQQKRQLKVQNVQSLKNIEKVPKPPPYTSQFNLKRTQHQHQRRAQEAQMVQTEIARFEANREKLVTYGFASSLSGLRSSGDVPRGGSSQGYDMSSSGVKMILQSNSKYLQDIRQRLEENAVAREQREKRVDRFLVEQFKAHQAQEDTRRDEQLVKRLTRQTREEQRLANQLLQMRMQKEVIRKNRLFREQQYQQRREKDIQEALEREAALAQHAKLERAESIRKEMQLCNRCAAERAQSKYKKHFASCKEIVEQIVDLATKIGEYRLTTGNLIPEKQMREWKELLFNGLPLYEPIKGQQPRFEFSTPLDPVELKKQDILNNQDYDEYTNMVGEWAWPEEAGETKLPLTNNNVLGHVVTQLRNIVHPPVMETSSPSFPHFTLKACVLGKFCSGKTSCLAKIAEAHGIYVLSIETLIDEAVNAYQNEDKLSTRAMQGAAVEKEIRKGNRIPNELLVDIIVEAIRQVPAQSGWILDGFPADIIQAYLLEEALGGSVDVGNDVVSNRTNLVADPNPPKPPTPPAPVLDLALLLDIPDECVVRRAFSHTAFATPPVENVVLDSGKAPDSSFSAAPVDQPPGLTDEAPGPTDSHSSLTEEKTQRHSRKGSTSSVTHEGSQEVPKDIPESASPCPGSSNWVYVDEPLPPEIPEHLCSHWEATCDSYVNSIKTVMQQLRSQRSFINHHLCNIREDYKHYLGRPDLKQELVSKWQKDFNSIPDDMREDEETKAELHLRMDELCDQLWDIGDKRKEENEQEKAALMGKGWVEDHTAMLINHHSILMQVELDRFHATLCILKVYYSSMCSQVLPELPSNFVQKVVKTEGQDQTEPIKPPHEKLVSDYEEAITAISKLVSAEAHQGETKEEPKSLQGKEVSKATSSPPVPPQAPSPALADDRNSEKSLDQEVKNKTHNEFSVALDHEVNLTKMRIALLKGHGLAMVHSLQSRAEETSDSMQKWLEANYIAEMKSIERLSEVVHNHIQTGDKLKYELVLIHYAIQEFTDFYLNGDCLMVDSLPPPPCPPTLEKPMASTPTITQLESLYKHLRIVAPSGFISSLEFFNLLRDIISVNWARNTLPEPWSKLNETQLMEIVSLLTDDYELIDWRRFLLSAALPWPIPSLMQLLVVLQRFKAADAGDTGFINEEQYLQSELWFSNESAPPVPEDPSEPLTYDRLANLRKFFFQLFADHSFSPPRLDYVSMLQYFAADTNPKQGFIRALSAELGQHLKHSSPGHLVKSMPSIEEATELGSSELDGEYKEEEAPSTSSSFLGDQKVSISALLAVLCHKVTKMKDDYLPPGCLSREELTEVV